MDTSYFRDQVKESYPDIVIDEIKPIIDNNGYLNKIMVSGRLEQGIKSIEVKCEFTPNPLLTK